MKAIVLINTWMREVSLELAIHSFICKIKRFIRKELKEMDFDYIIQKSYDGESRDRREYYISRDKKSFLADRVGSVIEENLRREYEWFTYSNFSFILVSKIFPTNYIVNRSFFLIF